MCRLVPVILSGALGVLVLSVLVSLLIRFGLALTAAASGLVLLAAGVLACALTTAAKWILVGRCREAEHPLWSSFVWRNELADTFVEELAVPWLAGSAIGTPPSTSGCAVSERGSAAASGSKRTGCLSRT